MDLAFPSEDGFPSDTDTDTGLRSRNDYFALSVDADLAPFFNTHTHMSRPEHSAHFMHDDSCVDPRGILQCSHLTRFSGQRHESGRLDTLSRGRQSVSNPTNSLSFHNPSPPTAGPELVGCGKDGKAPCDGDDCASQVSCTSMCLVSCPSQCGEAGQAVYCHDDACTDQGQCADASCEEACQPCQPCQPCTDLNCSSLDVFDPFASAGPLISDGDKQAAAALASFGDQMESDASFFANQLQHQHQDHSGQFNMESFPDHFLANMSSQDLNLNAQTWTNADSLLASHILEYHHPLRNGMQSRSCPVDHRDFQISRCTLPKALNGVSLNGENYTHHLDGHPCGYEVDDLNQFAYHLFADHLPFQLCAEAASPLPVSSSSTLPPNDAPLSQYIDLHSGQATIFQPQDPFPTGKQQQSSSASSVPEWSAESPASPPSTHTSPPTLAQERWSAEPTGGGKGSEQREETFVCRWRVGEGDEICGKIFDSAVKLHAHGKQLHTSVMQKDEAGFHCCWSGCSRSNTFTQRSKLDRHLQTHTGFKPVQCTICKEYFSAKQALIQHMRVHTGEQPWKCRHPGCSRTFKQQSALTMHERTHTGERPLQCDICGKTFGESSNLSKHRRTHNDKGNYICTICDKDFNRHDQLRRHAMRKHGLSHPEEVDVMINRPKKTRQSSSMAISLAAES